MKIAFVAVKGIPIGGGIEKLTEEIGTRLVNKGHEVTVYSSRDYGTSDGIYRGEPGGAPAAGEDPGPGPGKGPVHLVRGPAGGGKGASFSHRGVPADGYQHEACGGRGCGPCRSV